MNRIDYVFVHALVCACCLSLAEAEAQAEVVLFENPTGPSHFSWVPPSIEGGQSVLSILHSSEDQGAAVTDHGAFSQNWSPDGTSIGGASPNRVQRRPSVPSGAYRLLDRSDSGEQIPSPAPITMSSGGILLRFEPATGDPASDFEEGVPSYIGVRFNLGAGDQFGWIGVVRNGPFVDPFAWAYETTPGLPITTPEPGSLAMLALGAVGLLARQRS